MKLTEAEIRPGLLQYLDPDALEAHGASYTCAPERRVLGRRLWLCVQVDGGWSLWLPLYSRGDGRTRLPVSAAGRTGHVGWTAGPAYWDARQVWRAPAGAVLRAAQVARDLSRPLRRNRLRVDRLPGPWRLDTPDTARPAADGRAGATRTEEDAATGGAPTPDLNGEHPSE